MSRINIKHIICGIDDQSILCSFCFQEHSCWVFECKYVMTLGYSTILRSAIKIYIYMGGHLYIFSYKYKYNHDNMKPQLYDKFPIN